METPKEVEDVAEDFGGMSGKPRQLISRSRYFRHKSLLSLSLPPFLLPSLLLSCPLSLPSLEDASDTRRLLGKDESSHNYGSAPPLSDPATRRGIWGLRDRLHFSWPNFKHLLSLLTFWKHQQTQSPRRRIDINSEFPESSTFCSNRIRYKCSS